MLNKITGSNIKAIQRRSYRMPIKKEGITSPNETPPGRKAIKVAILNKVNISRKMSSRLVTHSIVLGILYLNSIRSISFAGWQKDYKRIEFNPFQQVFCPHKRPDPLTTYFCENVFFGNHILATTGAMGPRLF